MQKDKNVKIMNYLVFGVIFAVYMTVTLFLFHRQSVGYGGRYVSDVGAYIAEISGEKSGLFPYPIMFWIAEFFALFIPAKHAMAMTVTLLNGLSLLIIKYFLDKRIAVLGQWNAIQGVISSVLSVSLLLVAMLYPPAYLGSYAEIGEGYLYRYKGVFSPNPYHNATYLAARPFAIVTFFLFCMCIEKYEKERKWVCREYLLFSVFLLLSTMAKPSFTLVLVTFSGIFMISRLVVSRFRNWRAFLQLGIWFIPTFADLLYQYGGVFTGPEASGEKGIGIGWLTAWSTANDNILAAIFCNLLFPLTVLCFQWRKVLKNTEFMVAWGGYGVALFTLSCLYEKGYRLPHLNFAWGYMYGIFFLFLVSAFHLLKCTFEKGDRKWELAMQWGAFAIHLIFGMDYMRVLLSGGLFL